MIVDSDISPGIAFLAQRVCGWAPLWSEIGSRSYLSGEEQAQACRNQPGRDSWAAGYRVLTQKNRPN
jgi:hypothetical protein